MDTGIPLVVKDSWQYPDRHQEGELLQEATEKGVINVARYHHHSTVCIYDKPDDIQHGIRRGLDVGTASNYRERLTIPTGPGLPYGLRKTWDNNRSSQDASLPPTKRPRLTSPTKTSTPNRIHRRIVTRDYGKPIYLASSHATLLAAFKGCIEGHRSLLNAEILHKDISVNNVMINEDDKNPSWPSFLIDLDLAITLKNQRSETNKATEKAGTRAFMAAGLLLGEKHTFMHDLESFFWVIFWICIHYEGPGQERLFESFDRWHYKDTKELANIKRGTVSSERDFLMEVEEDFTPYYRPLIPCVIALRNAIFPGGQRWQTEDMGLYDLMIEILDRAQVELSIER